MARTQRKYSGSRNKDSLRTQKLNTEINTDFEHEEKITGYKISGKKRWNRHHSPDFDYGDW